MIKLKVISKDDLNDFLDELKQEMEIIAHLLKEIYDHTSKQKTISEKIDFLTFNREIHFSFDEATYNLLFNRLHNS